MSLLDREYSNGVGSMKNRDIKTSVAQWMKAGINKAEIYDKLVAQGAKKKSAAFYIASYADPRLKFRHDGKVNLLVTIMLIQAALAALLGATMAAEIHTNAKWLIAGLFALIPLLFAWGFYKYSAMAYNAYILLSIIQIPGQLSDFMAAPLANTIALSITVAILVFVWSLRSRLFPDFAFIFPRKINGEYVFIDG